MYCKDRATYNKNLFTQYTDQGHYFNSDISGEISSNIGISFAEGLNPIERTSDDVYSKEYVDTPETLSIKRRRRRNDRYKKSIDIYSRDNMYDPRFSGYGDQSRSYVDDLTGSVKFFYDDVDNINMPREINRSNIDVYLKDDSKHCGSRKFAQDNFLDNTLKFRTDIQTLAMRKNNRINSQKRMYPKYTL